MQRDWNVKEMIELTQRIARESRSPYRNVHAQWLCKQDLYAILWAVESALDSCNTFSDETEYLQSHERHELMNTIRTSHAPR